MGTVRRQKAKAERLFKAACEYYEKDDYQQAATLFEDLLRADAGVYRTQDLELWLAASYLESRDYQKAAPLLDKLLKEVSPTDEPLRYGHVLSLAGKCYSYSGSFETAVKLLEELEQFAQPLLNGGKMGLLLDGRYARGHALVGLGRPAEALKTLDLAEDGVPAGSIEPATKSVLDYERAVALHHLGAHNRSARLLETVDPARFHENAKRVYWHRRTRLHEWNGEHDRALESFKKLEALGIPDYLQAEAHHWAGRAYFYLGKGPESVYHFRESMRHHTDRGWVGESNTNFWIELKKAGWV